MSKNPVSRRRFVSLAAAPAAAGPLVSLGRYPCGYGDGDIRAVPGGNFRRALGEIRVA